MVIGDNKDEKQEESNKVTFVAGNAKGSGMSRVVRKELDELNSKIDNAIYDVPVTDLSGLSTEDYVTTTVDSSISDALTGYATTGSLNSYSLTSHDHDGEYSLHGHTHNYLPTAGGTMTGSLKIQYDNPTIYFRDTNNRTAMIHVNSSRFYILRGAGNNSTTWDAHNAHWPLEINLDDNNATFGGDIYMRARNGHAPSISRVGGVFFTWDSDSYGTNTHHSIRSTYGDSYTDCITINSFGHVRINIDSNANGGNNFEIGSHTTGTGNRILYIPDTGYGIYLEKGWFRAHNNDGLYFQKWGGGWRMTDGTWIRAYNDKGIHTGGNMDASGYLYTGDQVRIWKGLSATNGSWNYTHANVRMDTGNNQSDCALSGHPHGGVANMFVWAKGSSSIYVRNWDNKGWARVEGQLTDHSTRRIKKNITPLRAKSVGAAASKTVLSDTLKQIELVEYELDDDNSGLSRIPDNWETKVWDEQLEREVWVPNERRQRAYERLNEIRARSGLGNYRQLHRCGKDCDKTPDDPCHIHINGTRRIPGFIAEQAIEHIPGVIELDKDGEPSGVSLMALSGFLMGVVQELVDRVDELESAKNPTVKGNQ